MYNYVYWNDLLAYCIGKNILPATYNISYTIGSVDYVIDTYGITKDGVVISRSELTTTEQNDILTNLSSSLSQYKPLINSNIDTMTPAELDNFLAGNYNDVDIIPIQGKSCFTVIHN